MTENIYTEANAETPKSAATTAFQEPLISVIMPAYDMQKFIAESISSVIAQSYTNWELIIVDDGSTDQTSSIVAKFIKLDNRIKYFYQPNSGQGKARNLAIHESNGALVAFLDADDSWMPEKLQKQTAFIRETNADLIFSDIIIVDEKKKVMRETWGVMDKIYSGDRGIISFMFENKAPMPAIMAKKESILKLGGFSESEHMRYVEDYDLWLRMLQHNSVFASSAEKLATYRLQSEKSSERRRTILNVVTPLIGIHIADTGLMNYRDTALKFWARRCIKSCFNTLSGTDLKKIIQLLPAKAARSFFSLLNVVAPPAFVGKCILVHCRSAMKKMPQHVALVSN